MTRLKISGMTCGHCEMSVSKALAAVPGVTKVINVSKDSGEAVVEGTADGAALVAAVAKQGYEAQVVT